MLNNINTAALFVITIIKFEIYYLSLNIIVLEIIKVIKNVINSVISLVISKNIVPNPVISCKDTNLWT